MSSGTRTGQASYQVVSDLGQLKVFTDPLKIMVLRVLQHQQLTVAEIAALVDEPDEVIAAQVEELMRIGMIEEAGAADVYRSTARIFHLSMDRGSQGCASSTITPASIAAATAESVGRELGASLTTWPDQLMNLEGRRARMSHARALEFNERLVELIQEYWGGPDQPVDENPEDPLMSFIGVWYRFPEKDQDGASHAG